MKRCRHQVSALVLMFILLPMFPFANANGQPAPGDLIHEWTDGFNRPAGVAVDKDGNVYVADTNNNKIKVFDSQGIQIYEWGGWPWGRPIQHPIGHSA